MILITEFMDEAAVKQLAAAHVTRYAPELADEQHKLPQHMAGITAIIVRNRTQVSAELLAQAPDLQCVGRLGVGLDNIDVAACQARNITVYPATGANDLSVAEYVITTAMALLRGAYQSQAAMLAGTWPRQACAGREISGKTLGLIGYGSIARETAARATAMGMKVCAYDPFVDSNNPIWGTTQALPLEALLPIADVVSLHVPLNKDTFHLINHDKLALMKTEAVLINAARGGVVDEAALAHVMHKGILAGAALDVFEEEPLTATAAAKFNGLNNLLLTPHIAGVTVESNVRVSQLIANLVDQHLTQSN
ncbi:MAG: hydroxyacid dehydrogenase [Gammaproteobacteria bacterium]|nr:hydroxyacid dehydrogenase [Gammaproteobacteria bacterium]MCP4879445.1 hydroxyacid dehydrogenase [Gammaproteobacteria bacterium]